MDPLIITQCVTKLKNSWLISWNKIEEIIDVYRFVSKVIHQSMSVGIQKFMLAETFVNFNCSSSSYYEMISCWSLFMLFTKAVGKNYFWVVCIGVTSFNVNLIFVKINVWRWTGLLRHPVYYFDYLLKNLCATTIS